LAQSTISTHLKTLADAGLIDFSKEGLWVVYKPLQLENEQLKQLVESLLAYLDKDEELIALLKKLKTIDRYKACQKES
jgi:ArsR family transcriptional regulator